MSKQQKADRATRTLINYFQILYDKAGIAWMYENGEDIENAVQNIIEAATPEPDTTELTKDRLQEIIREYQEAQLGLINKQYEALKERDAVRQKLELAESKAANEFLLHQEARDKTRQAERRAEAIEKERDDLRELLRELYSGISAMDLRRKAAALLPDVEFAG